jgi:hypothetical protein
MLQTGKSGVKFGLAIFFVAYGSAGDFHLRIADWSPNSPRAGSLRERYYSSARWI